MNYRKRAVLRGALFTLVLLTLLVIAVKQGPSSDKAPFDISSDARGVADWANLLDSLSVEVIQQETEELEKVTGVCLAVFTVRTTGDYKPEIYAARLFNAWRPESIPSGEKAIIFMARDEGFLSIERSLGLEFILSSQFCNDVMHNYMLPLLNQADQEIGRILARGEIPDITNNEYIGAAMLSGVKAVRARIEQVWFEQSDSFEQVSHVEKDTKITAPWRSRTVFTAILLILVAGGGLLAVFFYRRCTRCGGRLKVETVIIRPGSANKHGLKELTFKCYACGYIKKKKQIIFPPFTSSRGSSRRQ